MAKARGPRPRTLAVVFGAYFLFIIVLAYLLSPTVAGYVDPGATRWLNLAYALLGAVLLAGVSVGAVRRWMRLDARLAELEYVATAVHAAAPATRVASSPPAPVTVHASEPTDQEVDQLLEDLHKIGDIAEGAMTAEEPETMSAPPVPAEELTVERQREIRRIRRVLESVGAYAAGPAVASSVLLGVFTAMMPASDGMLLTDLQLNAFVGLSGVGCLVGLVLYAAAAFRQVARRVA